ncbi:MAG: PD-(D/E)XK nuclease family protein [Usitatibacter sp.]
MFERLALGHEARITVVTPNARLAQALGSEFAAFQRSRGLQAWETADVLPFGGLVARLWEDALYSELAAAVPVPLSAPQEQALWEEAIHATRYAQALFSAAPAAAQCRAAWKLAHAWRLPLELSRFPGEDARAFLDWSSRYERATRDRRQTDAARLPDIVAPHLAHAALRKPATLIVFGVDIVTPQMRDFVDALARHGCEIVEAAPPARRAEVKRVALTDAREEIEMAARWARSRLATPAKADVPCPPRIGVVVPDLASCRARVQRVFANVLRPDHLVAGEVVAMPFNISLGLPLAEYPLIADALLVIGLASHESAFEQASRVIRSPFIAGAESEMQARARLDAELRKRCGPAVALDSLVRLAKSPRSPRAPLLADRIERLAQFRKAGLFGTKPASEWARAFSEALRLMGFPGERTLDSSEHQALDKWHGLLAELAALERVVGKMGFNAARERLGSMAREAIFQPEARDVPIQVMGILESAGQEFDHLWVMGLTDEAWPLAARPDPFIPVPLQRAAGIPQSDPVSSLDLDRRITQGWLTSAAEVVVSHPRMKKESELAPSPLIASIPAVALEELGIERCATLRETIRTAGAIEQIEDGTAPPIAAPAHSGGTGLFKDQSECPFRAFARRRLASEPLETPRPGLDPRERGNLVHEMMKGVWKRLDTSDALAAADDASLAAILGTSADEAIASVRRHRPDVLAGRYAVLEHARLMRLASAWLAIERERPGFAIVTLEEKRPIAFGGVTVNAKLDRMDRLAAGGHAIIDYKTGECRTASWMGKRPTEPQLPMYALGGGEDVAAVAFGVVKTGEARFKGISREPKLLPGVVTIDKDYNAKKMYRDWDALVGGWRVELEAIGRGFAAGDARVDPKRPDTCKNCDQPMFCRIAEKAPFGVAGAGEGDPDE